MNSFGQLSIIKRTGEDSGIVCPITSKEILIGRDLKCDIRVQMPKVSREHCKIIIESGDVILHNISKNSIAITKCRRNTKAKLARNKQTILEHGDEFTIVDRVFRYDSFESKENNYSDGNVSVKDGSSMLSMDNTSGRKISIEAISSLGKRKRSFDVESSQENNTEKIPRFTKTVEAPSHRTSLHDVSTNSELNNNIWNSSMFQPPCGADDETGIIDIMNDDAPPVLDLSGNNYFSHHDSERAEDESREVDSPSEEYYETGEILNHKDPNLIITKEDIVFKCGQIPKKQVGKPAIFKASTPKPSKTMARPSSILKKRGQTEKKKAIHVSFASQDKVLLTPMNPHTSRPALVYQTPSKTRSPIEKTLELPVLSKTPDEFIDDFDAGTTATQYDSDSDSESSESSETDQNEADFPFFNSDGIQNMRPNEKEVEPDAEAEAEAIAELTSNRDSFGEPRKHPKPSRSPPKKASLPKRHQSITAEQNDSIEKQEETTESQIPSNSIIEKPVERKTTPPPPRKSSLKQLHISPMSPVKEIPEVNRTRQCHSTGRVGKFIPYEERETEKAPARVSRRTHSDAPISIPRPIALPSPVHPKKVRKGVHEHVATPKISQKDISQSVVTTENVPFPFDNQSETPEKSSTGKRKRSRRSSTTFTPLELSPEPKKNCSQPETEHTNIPQAISNFPPRSSLPISQPIQNKHVAPRNSLPSASALSGSVRDVPSTVLKVIDHNDHFMASLPDTSCVSPCVGVPVTFMSPTGSPIQDTSLPQTSRLFASPEKYDEFDDDTIPDFTIAGDPVAPAVCNLFSMPDDVGEDSEKENEEPLLLAHSTVRDCTLDLMLEESRQAPLPYDSDSEFSEASEVHVTSQGLQKETSAVEYCQSAMEIDVSMGNVSSEEPVDMDVEEAVTEIATSAGVSPQLNHIIESTTDDHCSHSLECHQTKPESSCHESTENESMNDAESIELEEAPKPLEAPEFENIPVAPQLEEEELKEAQKTPEAPEVEEIEEVEIEVEELKEDREEELKEAQKTPEAPKPLKAPEFENIPVAPQVEEEELKKAPEVAEVNEVEEAQETAEIEEELTAPEMNEGAKSLEGSEEKEVAEESSEVMETTNVNEPSDDEIVMDKEEMEIAMDISSECGNTSNESTPKKNSVGPVVNTESSSDMIEVISDSTPHSVAEELELSGHSCHENESDNEESESEEILIELSDSESSEDAGEPEKNDIETNNESSNDDASESESEILVEFSSEEEETKKVDYNKWTCVELRKELKNRKLETKGLKATLVKRLEKNDELESQTKDNVESSTPQEKDEDSSEEILIELSESESSEEEVVSEQPAKDYNKMTCVVLRKELKARKLDTKGLKAKLVARLIESDRAASTSKKNKSTGRK